VLSGVATMPDESTEPRRTLTVTAPDGFGLARELPASIISGT
jgi:hypothetical protein